jgi:hypothetical protein
MIHREDFSQIWLRFKYERKKIKTLFCILGYIVQPMYEHMAI